jgi:hemoglobin
MVAVTLCRQARRACVSLAMSCCCLAAAGAAVHTTLYDRLGGAAGVTAIADELIDRVSSDPKLGQSFKDTKLDHIKKLLAEQLCELSGGPCHYSGDSMREVHAGHHISQAEFYGMVEDLRAILRERRVSLGATNQLLRLLAPMRRDVVEPPQTKAEAEAMAAEK